MSERENILGRIREALTVPAPRPAQAHGEPAALAPKPGQNNSHADPSAPDAAAMRRWLPAVGESLEDKLELFRKNATDLKANFVLINDVGTVGQRLQALRDAEAWTKIGIHAGELTDIACDALKLPMIRTDRGYDANELESCSVGITQCDALVAQTGSVLVTSRSSGGRGLSVLPPHHVVLARRSQLVRDLPEAFALLKTKYAPDFPSFISFITGPSRTGDIERILVLGAHGPKKLTILCV